MLKPLLLATTTLLPLIFYSLNTIELANAATKYPLVQNTDRLLVAKGNKSSHINSQQQSDVNNIHQTLTQLYRSINQRDVESMFQAFTPSHANEKVYVRRLFSQIASEQIDMSVEVQKIRLIDLSANNAIVKVDLTRRLNGARGSASSIESATLELMKYHGKWRISDAGIIIKSIDRAH